MTNEDLLQEYHKLKKDELLYKFVEVITENIVDNIVDKMNFKQTSKSYLNLINNSEFVYLLVTILERMKY